MKIVDKGPRTTAANLKKEPNDFCMCRMVKRTIVWELHTIE